MKYVISDIHGCFDKFIEMLDLINFKDTDTLYILGDIVDRGDNSLDIIRYIKKRNNIILLMGNHEALMISSYKDETNFPLWMHNGGINTFNQLSNIDDNELISILNYLKELPLVEIVDNYILCHAGLYLPDNHEEMSINEILELQNDEYLLWDRDFIKSDKYIKDYIVIVGHTPTISISDSNSILKKEGKILIDCGAVFAKHQGRLSCLCLDNMEEFYI